jgi:hypothetical protein
LDGLRRYIISAIDSKLKFAFLSCYRYLSNRNGRDFLKRLEMVYPLNIKSMQTDNGPEFLGDFDEHLKSKKYLIISSILAVLRLMVVWNVITEPQRKSL